jgi:DNA-directed RNA polymerase II subunit RPB1
MQRKLIKSFEDIMVKYDGTVRNANNAIVQYVYGDSGADTISQFEYEIQLLEMNNQKLEEMHKFSDKELKDFNFSSKDNDNMIDDMKQMRNHILKCVRRAKLDYIAKIKTFMIPVNLNRIIDYAKENKSDKSDLTPKYVLEKIEELLTNKEMPLVCMTKKEQENKNCFKNIDDKIHKTVLRTAIYDALSPRKVIVEYGLDKETFNGVLKKIKYNFIKSIVEPGEMVGVIAATATGEPLTQMNLSSFHQAGVSRTNVGNMGVPRMREIFSVSKNPKAPEMNIYLNPEIRNKKEIVHKIKSNLKYTLFNEVRKRITCFYDPNPKFNEGITKKDNIIPVAFGQKGASKTSCQQEIHHLPFLIRIEIDREKIAEKEIKLMDIVSQFCNWWELRYVDTKNIRREERRVMNKITQLATLCNGDNNQEQVIHIRFNARDYEKDKFDLNTINDFIQYVLDKFKLKGINDITDTYNYPEDKISVFDEKTGEIKIEKEFVIYTAGVNLKEIRYMNGIDLNRTIANDIVEVYNTFGIEIARSLLMSEISNAYSRAGGEVNAQHIEIIVDQMTMSGAITSIDRHGLNKSDADPLSRASFEKPVEQLWTAALFGEIDHMNGVSSKIMVGECIKGGTGYPELILDTEMIENSEYEESAYEKKFEEIKTESLTADILNRGKEEDMFMPM